MSLSKAMKDTKRRKGKILGNHAALITLEIIYKLDKIHKKSGITSQMR